MVVPTIKHNKKNLKIEEESGDVTHPGGNRELGGSLRCVYTSLVTLGDLLGLEALKAHVRVLLNTMAVTDIQLLPGLR